MRKKIFPIPENVYLHGTDAPDLFSQAGGSGEGEGDCVLLG